MKLCYAILLSFALGSPSYAQQTYYVSVTGQDVAGRDGLSVATAWKSLAYACSQVPEGNATIELGVGTFAETETAHLKSGFTIVGQGVDKTTVTNTSSFVAETGAKDYKEYRAQNYLVYVPAKRKNIAIKGIKFTSPEANLLHGAINIWDSDIITVEDVDIHTFSWNGLRMNRSDDIKVLHCNFHNASLERHQYSADASNTNTESSGAIRALYHKNVEIAYCTITSDKSDGYGYKGGGHENLKFHNNVIDITGYFGIEIPHENEAGVEIYNNAINRCISVPKTNGGSNPASKGFDYAIWIHDNELSDSYTVEGPRNYLRITDNHVEITKGNGRFYTQHGGTADGPVLIAGNTISVAKDATLSNPFRGFIFVRGTARDVEVYNNTVYFYEGGWAIDYDDAAVSGWQVRNNVFIDPGTAVGNKVSMCSEHETVGTSKIAFSNNLAYGLRRVPTQGGTLTTDPGLNMTGGRPAPFFAPISASSVVVDGGVDVGRPYEGSAPDIGSQEWNSASTPSPAADTQDPVAGTLSTGTITTTSVALSWTAATDNVGVTNYEVYQDGNNVKTLTASQNSYTVTDLASSTEYTFRVNALDASGNQGSSNQVNASTLSAAPSPSPPGSNVYYMARPEDGGDDGNPGTEAAPFATLRKFDQVAQPGNTLYVRGGIYYPWETILTKSGSSGKPITVRNYPGEVPIFDGNRDSPTAGTNGIVLDDGRYSKAEGPKSYWTFDGLVLRNWKRGGFYFGDVFGPDKVEVFFDGLPAGDYTVRIRYRTDNATSNGVGFQYENSATQYSFPGTSGGWSTYTLPNQMKKNDNNRRQMWVERGDGDFYVDWIELEGQGITQRIQAEDGNLSGQDVGVGNPLTVESSLAGFEGSGYVGDFANAGRSPSYVSVHHIIVQNSIVDGCGQLGIRFTHSDHVQIRNSIFSRNGWDKNTGSWSSNINFIENNGTNILIENCAAFHGVDVSGYNTDGNGLIIDTHAWTKGKYLAKATVKNCLFFKNGGAGIAWTNNNDATIINCTLYKNGIEPTFNHKQTGIVFWNASQRAVLRNNVIVESSSGVGLKVIGLPGEDKLVNPVFENNFIAGRANYQDPQLVDPENYNFAVKAGSPAIDGGSSHSSIPTDGIGLDPKVFKKQTSGQPISWYDTAPDLEYIENQGGLANCFTSVARGSDPDIGAYEWKSTTPPSPTQHTITVKPVSNGSIDPSGSVMVNQGEDQSFTITPDTGYRIKDIQADGSSVGNTSPYELKNVTKSITVEVFFEAIPPATVPVSSVTVSGPTNPTSITTDGGSVQLSAKVQPTNATDKSVTWSIQGADLGATVSASGIVTASGETSGNGTITARATANDGPGVFGDYDVIISNQASDPTPDTEAPTKPVLNVDNASSTSVVLSWSDATDNVGVTGYQLYQDGNEISTLNASTTSFSVSALSPGTTYSFFVRTRDAAANSTDSEPVTATTLLATTVEYTITASVGPGGSINPVGELTLPEGSDQSFTVITEEGYQISDLLVDGNSVGSGASYTFTDLQQNHTISVAFEAIPPPATPTDNADTQAPEAFELTAAATASSLTLTWNTPQDNVGLAGYVLYQNEQAIDTLDAATTTYTIDSLQVSTPYTFVLVAFDAADNATEATYSVTLEEVVAPGEPQPNEPQPTPPPVAQTTVPPLFTPNDDGINDTWQITLSPNEQLVALKVYNQHGQLIFATNQLDQPWNGTFRGTPLPKGPYYYSLETANISTNVPQTTTGSVALIR